MSRPYNTSTSNNGFRYIFVRTRTKLKISFREIVLKISSAFIKSGGGRGEDPYAGWNLKKDFPEGFSVLRKAVPIVKPLNSEDKSWLMSHSSREEKELETMYRVFQSDYPTGAILRP